MRVTARSSFATLATGKVDRRKEGNPPDRRSPPAGEWDDRDRAIRHVPAPSST